MDTNDFLSDTLQMQAMLDKLVDDIYEAVGVRASVTAAGGRHLAQSDTQKPLCQVMDADDTVCAGRCAACAEEAARRAAKQGGVYIYRCWRGLMCACTPINVDGETIGRLTVSGFVSTPESMAHTEQIDPDPAARVSPEDYPCFPFLHEPRVRDVVRIISIAAEYLTEMYMRRRAERLQERAQFQALQSQIRPHFLFNTLNSISQMALLEGAEQAPEAIYALAGILRRTMRQSTQPVSLSDELKLVADYVRIKQLTGRSPVEYLQEIAPPAETLLLPSFCIQPLVENAIVHGLEPLPSGGRVTVTAYADAERVQLAVTDDGAGFDPSVISASSGGEMSGIGFANVLRRLESYFGKGFSHKVISAPGQGTTIALYIPRDKAVFLND